MKTFDLFVVEIKKRIHDTLNTESGLELYIDNRFDEVKNRTTEAPVIAVPFKYDTGVEVGDTLYFHHLVVINDGQPLTGEDNHYLVRFDPDHTGNNPAIAYKSAKTGDIHPLAGWSLLERVEEREEKQSDIIDVVKLKDSPVTKGKVSFTPPWVEELGLEVGDVVGFGKNMDYRITIEDKEYYRVRAEDLMYVER